MTYLLISLLGVTTAGMVTAIVVAVLLARGLRADLRTSADRLRDAGKGLTDLEKEKQEVQGRLDDLDRALENSQRALLAVTADNDRLTKALAVAERQRARALDDLARAGDARGIGTAIRGELERVSTLSELPRAGAPAAASGTDRDRADAVHDGAADGDD